MNILVTYDVNTLTSDGRRRLRKVAKICQGSGQRVQYSVFECAVNEMQKERLLKRLLETIDKDEDSLRVYRLTGERDGFLESYGRDTWIDFHGTLVV
jgi:CRISPR-associated protein Cas2